MDAHIESIESIEQRNISINFEMRLETGARMRMEASTHNQ